MRLAVLLAATLLLVPAAGLAAPPSAAQTAFDSTVTIDVSVQSSGDARFNVSTAYRLHDSTDEAAFDRVAADFSAGRAGFQADDFREVADRASNVTGRSMGITGVERNYYVHNESGNATGVLALEFTWTNFAERSGNRIVVEDAFATGWLDHLEPGMRLRVHSPPQFGAHDVQPAVTPRNGTLTWQGPFTFDDGGPEIVYLGGLDPGPSTDTATVTTPGDSLAGEFRMVFALAAVVLVGGLLAYVWTRRDGEVLAGDGVAGASGEDGAGPDDGSSVGPADDGSGTAPGPGGGRGDGDGPDAVPDDAASGDGADPPTGTDGPDEVADAADGTAEPSNASGDASAAGDDADDEPEIDEELLSDEERVERMLRRNGGRMKQANIVTETGWSNAKVSQLLSGMADEERIEKLRLGRENLIILPEADEAGDEF